MIDKTVHEMQHGKALEDRTLDELDELEDLEDDRVLEYDICIIVLDDIK